MGQSDVEEREQYFVALEKWLQEAYTWQSMSAMFPYFLLHNISQLTTLQQQQGAPPRPAVPGEARRVAPEPVPPAVLRQVQVDGVPQRGLQCAIPPLWKRFAAEVVDFLILFFLKITVTYIAADFFSIIDLEKYELRLLQQNIKLDYRVLMEMTSEIFMLEVLHRTVVCVYEALWLWRGLAGRVGGATPGKAVLGLRVVQCQRVVQANGVTFIVIPGTDLGLGWSVARSLVKNLVLPVLFPVWFNTVLFHNFQHNRITYDVMCHSMVVEDPRRR
ncbi:protein FAM8A1 [Bacillus rossius redtenbacheri]|uniref:protein FAM8A1 n=1 Tax=Bacillus rossius redtenbacheri TaxID=93214 RepID=UPI002FDEC7C6